jgi:hypothetical protein
MDRNNDKKKVEVLNHVTKRLTVLLPRNTTVHRSRHDPDASLPVYNVFGRILSAF